MSTDLIARARGGDEEAFAQLVGPHRRELSVHCYRILGSIQDAEDALQEALLAAWQGLGSFAERASIRTWLFRIATNRCLNMLRTASRRPPMNTPLRELAPPEPTRLGEVVWLEPYPDVLLSELPDDKPGPEARYEAREAISLAFVRALQLLPPRQRAALILQDVIGFHTKEVAHILESSEESVRSALKRARAGLQNRLPRPEETQPPPARNSPVERDIIERLTRAYELGDVDGLVALLTDEVVLTASLSPAEYVGRDICTRFFRSLVFGRGRTYRLIETRANGQPAFGVYTVDRVTQVAHANGMLVLTLAGSRISAMTHFDNGVLSLFGLPRILS